MVHYWPKVAKRAWTDSLYDCGFRDIRGSVVKIVWTAIALLVAFSFGGAGVLAGHLGNIGTAVIVFLCFIVVIFLWNFLTAPAKLQQEADAEIAVLRSKLDNREARRQATARLWALRAQGTAMRNQRVIAEMAAAWKESFEEWREHVLEETETVSPNFRAWLDTLDRIRPGPVGLPRAATDEHDTLRSRQSEILHRMEEFLRADMLHRDIGREI